jgi:outer membrane protein TolC
MVSFRKLSLVFVLLCLASRLCDAQTLLSLDNAVQEGVRNNFGLKIARNEALIEHNNATAGNAGLFPILSVYAGYEKSSVDAKVEVVTGAELNRSAAAGTLTTAGITARWVVFDGLAMFYELDKLKQEDKIGELELKQQLEQTVAELTLAYCDIIRQHQILLAVKQHLAISNYQLEISKARLKNGLSSEQEMLKAEVLRQTDTISVINQQAEVQKAVMTLNRLMASDLRRKILTDDTIKLEVIPEINEMLKLASQMNSQQLMARVTFNIGVTNSKILKARQYPKVEIHGQYSLFENQTEAAFIGYNRTIGPLVGITAGIPVFDGMNLRRKIKNSELLVENEAFKIKRLEQELQYAILISFSDYRLGIESIELGREGVRLAEKNLLIARDGFEQGLISSLQLREAQDDLFQAKANLINSLFRTKEFELKLATLTGQLIKQ